MRTAIVLLLSVTAVSAQNWPSFRGSGASGVADGQNPPVSWNAEKSLNIAWKTAIPGLAHGGPVVWGDRIFVTSAISSDPKEFRHGLFGDVEPSNDVAKHSWRIYCLDKNSGKIIWDKTAYEGVPKTKRHPKSSQASSTPATDGKHVVAFFGSEGLYVYNTDGKLLWKQDLGVLNAGWFYDPDYEWGVASSPIIYKNLVIVQCDIQKNSFIAAFDVDSGKQVWRTARPEIPSWGTPTVYEGKQRTELITNSTKAIRGYDPLTGKELWKLTGNSEVTVTTPIAANETIYVANGYPPIQPIYAIKAGASGDITLEKDKDTNQSILWSKKRGGPYMPTPLLYHEILYTCSNNGILTAWNAANGEKIYQQRITEKSGAYTASPVAGDGRLYFSSEDGDIFVAKAGPTYELLASNPMGEVLMSTPAISSGMLIVRGEHSVFGIKEPAKN